VAEARDVAASALADPAADPAALAARARTIATHLHRRGADALPAALDTVLPAPETYRGEARP